MIKYIKKILLKRKLRKIKHKDIKLFSFNGINTYAQICDIYDGDTFKIIFFLDKKIIKHKIRLMGIDTPELRTKDEDEKKRGYEAKHFLEDIVKQHNNIMKVKLYDFDKYGRLLCDVYTNKGERVTDILIKNNHGYAYFGGTKQ